MQKKETEGVDFASARSDPPGRRKHNSALAPFESATLEQTYVNFQLPSYHTNLANELKKSRKTYLYDLGIRNSILKDFRPFDRRDDCGAMLESHVFLNMLSHLSPNMELRFWRTKKGEEVDFVLLRDRQPFPIEVKARWEKDSPPPGLAAFLRKYPSTHRTFTISANSRKPLAVGPTIHHFLTFEEVPDIFRWTD